ncbi:MULTISPECIES: exodeoxyribonuclease V subunit beta [unclassified Dyella]|uniref:exodeoxyribonuclease V subunit beta n=1 Tax=unclassified Dyella TaxID=2634549 RepID=UPI000C817FA6|nr:MULTISPECIES: exodeoxyribonuclease V subunit beta [unclassified Dyella]MDR3445823.1 exodeoxyribonuclease V subunit beta [Dyella sp.]PMQ04336.1 RecBCD enzyme subunit RecB [Dyella sp. AD56]
MTATAPLQPLQLPLQGIQLIEASAGTGKTWTIAALYLRLVLGHGTHQGKALLPSQILVLTFTKAATAELRERIRERLGEAADAFRGRREADEFLRSLIDVYPDDDSRARAARQLDLAAQWMDESAIHTIHAWCQRMLSQHAFDSGHPFVQDTDTDESALLADVVRDYWRCHFFPLDRDGAALISRWWKTPADLQSDLQPLLRQPPESLRLDGRPLPDAERTLDEFRERVGASAIAEAQARQRWLDDVDAIEALFAQALAAGALNGNKMRKEKVIDELALLRAWASDGADASIALPRYTRTALAAAKNKSAEALQHPAFDAIETCVEAHGLVAPWRAPVLAHATRWVAAKLEETKQRRSQLGFDDMLKRLDSALYGHTGKRLADTIATQYPMALIDEFQDTDPLQWRIFHRIYAHRDMNGLLLIGDPKQAIYGFRGADIHTYLRARTSARQPMWTLGTNYRSTVPLVDAVNRVFAFADTHENGAFDFGRGKDALPFFPVAARGRSDELVLDDQPLPPMQLAVQPGDDAISGTAYTDLMAKHAAAYLVDLLTAAQEGRCGFRREDGTLRPLQPGDIAILVRRGSEAAKVREEMQRRGLKSVYLSDRDSVYASPEATDLLRWLRACAEPGSDRTMRAALATPTLGQSDAELDRLNLDEHHWEACGDRFRLLHATWQRHGVLAMLHDLLHAFDLPGRLLSHLDGERALTNLLHLAELLQHAASTLDGEHALIRYLAAQIATASDPHSDTADEQIVRLESEAALIKVVTIHKSKGLEYPLVLLPFVCSARELKADDSFTWHDDDGELRMDLRADDAALARADRERLQEDLRLLYVALTRAQYACWLGVACTRAGQGKASTLHKSAFGHVLSGGSKIEPAELLPRLDALRGDGSDMTICLLDTPATQPVPASPSEIKPLWDARNYEGPTTERWRVSSYSGLKYAEVEHIHIPAPETAAQDTLIEASAEQPVLPNAVAAPAQGIHAFHAGAEAGTFLHDLLEWSADEGFAQTADDPSALENEIARRCQRRGWQSHIAMLTAWMAELLRTPLALPDGTRASLAQMDSHYAELEFWFEAMHVDTLALDRLVTTHTLDARPRLPLLAERINGLLKGFIDLVVEQQGRYYVIDYKSNKLGNDATAYTTEAMRDSILRERYDLQYALYTLALHRQLRARLPGYDYERHMGGVAYLYLRGVDEAGHGVHIERLPKALIEAMDHLFATGKHAHVA